MTRSPIELFWTAKKNKFCKILWNTFLTNLYIILLWISSSVPPSPNWSHCSVVGCLAKNGNCFLEYFTFHIQISQKIWDSNGLGIDWRTSTKLLSEGKNQHLWQVSDFPLPTRDMVFKKFYDQYFVPVLVFTRSDRGQGKGTITTTFGSLNLFQLILHRFWVFTLAHILGF